MEKDFFEKMLWDDAKKIIASNRYDYVSSYLEFVYDVDGEDIADYYYSLSIDDFFNLDGASRYIREGLLQKKIPFEVYAITQKSDGCNTIEVHGDYNHRGYEMWVDDNGYINITYMSDPWHWDNPEEGTLSYSTSSYKSVTDMLADSYHKNFEKMYATYDTPLKSISDVIKYLQLAKKYQDSVIATDLESGSLRTWAPDKIDTLISMLQDEDNELQDRVIVTENISSDAEYKWIEDDYKDFYENICTIPSDITPFEFFFTSSIL